MSRLDEIYRFHPYFCQNRGGTEKWRMIDKTELIFEFSDSKLVKITHQSVCPFFHADKRLQTHFFFPPQNSAALSYFRPASNFNAENLTHTRARQKRAAIRNPQAHLQNFQEQRDYLFKRGGYENVFVFTTGDITING